MPVEVPDLPPEPDVEVELLWTVGKRHTDGPVFEHEQPFSLKSEPQRLSLVSQWSSCRQAAGQDTRQGAGPAVVLRPGSARGSSSPARRRPARPPPAPQGRAFAHPSSSRPRSVPSHIRRARPYHNIPSRPPRRRRRARAAAPSDSYLLAPSGGSVRAGGQGLLLLAEAPRRDPTSPPRRGGWLPQVFRRARHRGEVSCNRRAGSGCSSVRGRPAERRALRGASGDPGYAWRSLSPRPPGPRRALAFRNTLPRAGVFSLPRPRRALRHPPRPRASGTHSRYR